MRVAVALVLLAALAGCSRSLYEPPASLYRHYGDRLRVYLNPVLGQPCGTGWGAPRKNEATAGDCFVYGPAQRISGLLHLEGFSPAGFSAGMTRESKVAEEWDRRWRVVSDRYRLVEPWPTRPEAFRPAKPRNYRVVFIGRTTERFSVKSQQRIVVIDRIEKVTRLAAMP